MSAVIANLDYVKEKNISAVFKAIVENGAISRIQIARDCQLAAGSVTKITRQLLSFGFIQEQEAAGGERGRPAINLIAVNDAFRILSICAGRHALHYFLCDLAGRCIAEHKEPMTATCGASLQKQLLDQSKSFIERFVLNSPTDTQPLVGVGITLPGLVNRKTKVVHYMPHIPVHNLALAEAIEQLFGAPCFVSNMTSAMALAEYSLSPETHSGNSVLVSIHNGVGSGMILDGRLYEGNSLMAGEIGHIQVDPLGPRCYCGNFGCMESYVSNTAIEERCRQLVLAGASTTLGEDVSMAEICIAANRGDELAITLLRSAAAKLGKVLAMCVNLLSPEKIILSGEITQAFEVIEPVLRHTLQQQTVSFGNGVETQLERSRLEEQRWLGGYALVRQALLDDGLLLRMMAA